MLEENVSFDVSIQKSLPGMHNLQVVGVREVIRSCSAQDLLINRLDERFGDSSGSQDGDGKTEHGLVLHVDGCERTTSSV